MDSLREQWLILISTPIYLIIIGLEILLTHLHFKKTYSWKEAGVNIYLMLLNGALDLVCRVFYLAVLQYFYLHSIITLQEGIMYWLVLLLVEDFLFYWLHRFDHEVRLFWAVHVTHHSAEHMNFTVGFRSSVFQPLYRFIYFIPLAFFGFSPINIAFMYSATQIWGIFVHTELVHKMGWLEYFMVTPSHHRVHHAINAKYLDKNMGMFLIVWDKIFGTFQAELPAEKYQPIKYGLTLNLENANAVNLVFHEWQSITSDVLKKGVAFKEKLNYVFGPPGWSHDGSRLTSEQMRAKEENTKELFTKTSAAETSNDLKPSFAFESAE